VSVSTHFARRTAARGAVALAMSWLLAVPFQLPAAQNPAGSRLLSLEIVDGEDAINDIKLGTAREPVVEVQDENHRPVAGAAVSFSLARHSLFNRTVFRATTNSTGRVHVNPLQLNNNPGRFEIHIKASYQGRTATITMHQTNVVGATGAAGATTAAPAVAAGAAAGAAAVPATTGLIAIVAIGAAVAAGATVGGLAATGVIGGSGGKAATISVGTPHF